MNKKLRSSIIVAVACAALASAVASLPVQTQQTSTPHTALSLSLLSNVLRATSADMREHFAPLLEGLAPRPKEMFIQLLNKNFNGDSLHAFTELYWRHHADTRKLEQTRTWLQTPFVRRIHAQYHQTLQPSEQRRIATFVQKAKTDPAAEKRRALLAPLVEEHAKATTDIAITLTKQALAVLNTLPSEQQPLTPQEISTMAESMQPNVLAYQRGTLEGLYLYVFRSVNEKDIQRYLSNHTSELGQWFSHLQWESYRQACSNAALHFAWQLQQAYTEALQSKTEALQSKTETQPPQAQPETPQNSSRAVSEALHNQAKGTAGRVLGVVTATVNNTPWYGYFNVEDNKDGTITFLALNTDTTPQEQIEITLAFHGVGTYPLQAGSAAFYKLANGAAVESYFSRGVKTDRIVITTYDKGNNIIEGSLQFAASSPQAAVSFIVEKFSARIK